MPRIGAGEAGGSWEVIVQLVKETLVDLGVEVYVYTLPAQAREPGPEQIPLLDTVS